MAPGKAPQTRLTSQSVSRHTIGAVDTCSGAVGAATATARAPVAAGAAVLGVAAVAAFTAFGVGRVPARSAGADGCRFTPIISGV